MFTPDQKLTVALLPQRFVGKSNVIFLPHPRNRTISPFLMFQNKLYEVLEVGYYSSTSQPKKSNSKSFFVGNNVVPNGSLLLISEIHIMIVVLPFLFERKNEFFSYDEYFSQTPYEQISQYIYPYFDSFGEFEILNGQKYWCFNDSKMLSFIEKKFERLSDYFRIKYDSKAFRIHENSLDVLRHYMPSKYVEHFKCYVSEKYPQMFPKIIFGNPYFLNKMSNTENTNEKKKKEKSKIVKFPYKRKKIPKYLINNREITSFFKPQKILA